MKRLYLCLALQLLAAGIASAGDSVLTSSNFAKRSVLSEGNWVKVATQSTGIYEISYETLRSMGFSNPEKVTVFGNGGTQMSHYMVETNGELLFKDDLTPIKVWHHNGKLFFYGLGVENLKYNYSVDNTAMKGYYSRESLNNYSYRGAYFLTDSREVTPMPVHNPREGENVAVESCTAFRYHETDLEQNKTSTGAFFWGESIAQSHEINWEVYIPDAYDNTPGRLDMLLYTSKGDFGTFSYGMRGGNEICSYTTKDNSSANYRPQLPSHSTITMLSGRRKVFADFVPTGNDPTFANIDYWVLSYKSHMPMISDKEAYPVAQSRFTVTDMTPGILYALRFENGADYALINIDKPSSPTLINVNAEGNDGSFIYDATMQYGEFVVFNPNSPQLQIQAWTTTSDPLANQNLHQYADEGADLLVICIPSLRTYAEEIADIHRVHDNMKVVVATTEECYNEFSGGVPDPMAYRMLAKMLHIGKTQLKNILLLGPLHGDFRGIEVEKDPALGIIAYQSPEVSIERGAPNVNDFYGMMTERIADLTILERNSVEIGVGVLPIKNTIEAENYVAKLKNYYADNKFAYRLNKFMGISGCYDKHTHDIQILNMLDAISNLDKRAPITTPLVIDAYGYDESRRKMLQEINDGTLMAFYMGHGAEAYLGQNYKFFNTPDVLRMKNSQLPFMLFGGCSISNSDRGRTGLGEAIVTGLRHGAIGTILSTRETWAEQNNQLFTSFFRILHNTSAEDTAPHRTEPLTIGEIYAQTKTFSTYANKLSYQLVCDPAITLPIATAEIIISNTPIALAGEDITLTGKVCDYDGNLLNGFNGEVVVRLMEPVVKLRCQEVVTTAENRTDGQEPLDISYAQTQSALGVAEVKNGTFTVNLHVPAYCKEFDGKTGRLHLAAFDPQKRKGASALYSMNYSKNASGTSSEELDTQAPVITGINFESTDCKVNVSASDNYALSLSRASLRSGFNAWLDGREISDCDDEGPRLTNGAKAYERSIRFGNLTAGQHSVRVRVKDAAGNSTEKEIVFSYNPLAASYSLKILRNEPDSEIEFGFEGNAPVKGRLILLDTYGNEIYAADFNDSSIKWNRCDINGRPVGKGHYKAYVIEYGNAQNNGHSSPIIIPVI